MLTPLDNDFERYRLQYEQNGGFKLMMAEKKALAKIFEGYTKASKRGVKIIPLR
jgi:hypothetical protein